MIGSFFVRAIDNSISEGFILTKSRHLNHGQRSAFSGRFYLTDFCPIFGIKIARRVSANYRKSDGLSSFDFNEV